MTKNQNVPKLQTKFKAAFRNYLRQDLQKNSASNDLIHQFATASD